jgi:sterol desaturase/sphingolipid hydroxylase (fatty acid hydroxylase superfamily)
MRRNETNEEMRIQERRPTFADIRRELKDSFYSLVLFSAYSVFLYDAYQAGHTAIYLRPNQYPLWWIPVSFFCAMFLHDTYFYFTHRLMHTRGLFRICHTRHHKSLTPTPWAILSFQPLETVFQFGFFALLIMFVPLHPITLVVYLLYDELVNAAGHCGHEFIPEELQHHWLLKYSNAVTHHDLHHSKVRCNYGHYFNFWDRVMGTFADRAPEKVEARPTTLERSPN